ncbi:hypothetical protein ACIBI4_21910 [Streptomyces sp. NPDC050418]|uniref:hypothetical protein n=1 Tax=Streptomyces sp. NPDC050418 TaxID=3365612 RepID=UPI0037982981
MAVRISALLAGVKTRLSSRNLDGVSFCDSCAQVCDTTCRSEPRLRATETALAAFGPVR